MTVSMRAELVLLATLLGGPACGDAADADGGSGDSSGGSDSSTTTTASTTTPATTSATTMSSTTAATDASADESSSTGSGSSDGDDSGSESSSTGELGCEIDPLAPDLYTNIVLEHDGAMRSYNLYVPAGWTGEAALPLVLNFHGLLGDSAQQESFSNFDPAADSHGLAVAYPQGLSNSWNAGACCGGAMQSGNDDVGFALAVIGDVKSRLCVDPKRVYATGMSNGGFMTHRLGCEAADSFAAIAPVAGVIGIPFEDCNPSRPVPVMHFHGTNDLLVPYGGGGIGFVSVADSIAQWVMHDGCTGEPVSVFEMDDAHCEAYTECEGDGYVELCTVENGGHCWPGVTPCPVGYSTTAIDASDRMAEFFLAHSLP